MQQKSNLLLGVEVLKKIKFEYENVQLLANDIIKNLAKEGLSNDEDGYKAEFIRLVETVK